MKAVAKKTIAPAKRRVLSASVKDRALTDMRSFFWRTDWGAWWEDFHLGLNERGGFKYRRLVSFIKVKSKSQQQKTFLNWYLGPKEPGWEKLPEAERYKWVTGGPVDWVERRKTGGWFHEVSLKKVMSEIARRSNAYEKMAEAGDKMTLPALVRAEKMAQMVDEAFRGEAFLPSLSFDQNMERAGKYLSLHERVQSLRGRALKLYALSQGINFDDMSGLVQLMTASAMAAAQRQAVDGIEAPTTGGRALKAMVEMALFKAAQHNLPLPEGAEDQIVAAEYAAVVKKKKDVQ